MARANFEMTRNLIFNEEIQLLDGGFYAIRALEKAARDFRVFVISPEIYAEYLGILQSGYITQNMRRLEDFRYWIEMACEHASLRTDNQTVELLKSDFPSWLSPRRLSYMLLVERENQRLQNQRA